MEVAAEAVIVDARRRQLNRRLWLAGLAMLAVAVSLVVYTRSQGGGGPATRASAHRPAEQSAPPLPAKIATNEIVLAVAWSGGAGTRSFSETPAIMRRPRRASDAVPRLFRPAEASSHSRNLGSLVYRESRAVAVEGQTVFLVPTTRDGICVLEGPSRFACMRGMDRPGIAWVGQSDGTAIMTFTGVASRSVSSVALVSDAGRVRAHLRDGFFWLDWNVDLTGRDPFLNLNPRFVVRYDNGRPPATESLRSP